MTDASLEALEILRSPENLQWHLVPLFAFVLYVYFVEVERRNWHVLLASLFYYAAEICWEMLNGLVLHFTEHSAVWTTPGDTAFLIFVGLTIEISIMFAVAGVIYLKSLPEDRGMKVLGMPNRLILPLTWGVGVGESRSPHPL